MKRPLCLLFAVSISLALGDCCLAGLAHVGSSLVCSDCHTMHYSMEHNYRGGPTDLVKDPTGPFQGLLKASPNELCLACHDGTGIAPDVLTYPTNDYPRQAGGLNRIGVAASGYENWKGHTLDSKATAPGGTWSDSERGLLCIDCHAQHGIASQFRNVLTSDVPGDKFQNKTLTYAFGDTNNVSKDVWLHDGFDLSHRYGVEGTEFNEPDPTRSRYGEWCASCHGNFHGSGGSTEMGGASGGDAGSNPWRRHPASDVNIGAHPDENSSLAQFQLHTNRVKTMSTSGNWSTGADVTPSCFSCHKAHGNRNAFGLIYMSGTGTVTEEGDSGGSKVQSLCRQCHVQ